MNGDIIKSYSVDGQGATGASGMNYAKTGLIWRGSDGNSYHIVSGAMFRVFDAGGGDGTTPYDPTRLLQGALTASQFVIAVAVLAGVTLALPKRYGVYFPYLILASYAAFKSDSVNRAVSSIGKGFTYLSPANIQGAIS